MRILVTGAAGYLGRGTVSALCDMGAEVVAVDFNTDCVDSRAERINCNLFEIANPYEHFGKPDVLLHMAWRDGFVHNSDAHIDDLPKHTRLIKDFARPECRICAIGTMHEIGFFEGAIDENTPCKPMSMYGIAKNALREGTALICKQAEADFQWLRGYYIVGTSKAGNSIFAKIVAAAEEGKKEFPFTTGVNMYDFLDYEEFCRQVAATAMQSKVTGIINICSGKPERLCDRVERFISDNSFDIKLKYGAFPDRPYDSKAVWGNGDKIAQIMKGV